MVLQEWLKFAPKPRALKDGERWNVFLSYRSINRAWVLNLYDVLKQVGHAVFLDQYELKPGDALIRRLEDALSSSQAGVLIWSSHTGDSDWVRKEYEALTHLSVENKDFHFVPVKLDRARLPLFAANAVFLDFSSYPDGPNGGELLRLLHAVVGKSLSPEAVRFANDLDEASMVAGIRIEAAVKNGLPGRLLELFKQSGVPWQVSAALGCKAAEGLTRLKKNEEAVWVLNQLMEQFPKAIRPKQLYALALARRAGEGDLIAAQEVLGELYAAGERDPETVGIYARTWMDRYRLSGQVMELKRSRDLYAEAFSKAPDDYYTGINAASKSVFLGTTADLAKADAFATQVQEIVGTTAWPDDYWKTATVAETFLIRKKYNEAAAMYQMAIDMAPTEAGSHHSTWGQARELLRCLSSFEEEVAIIEKVFEHLNPDQTAKP